MRRAMAIFVLGAALVTAGGLANAAERIPCPCVQMDGCHCPLPPLTPGEEGTWPAEQDTPSGFRVHRSHTTGYRHHYRVHLRKHELARARPRLKTENRATSRAPIPEHQVRAHTHKTDTHQHLANAAPKKSPEHHAARIEPRASRSARVAWRGEPTSHHRQLAGRPVRHVRSIAQRIREASKDRSSYEANLTEAQVHQRHSWWHRRHLADLPHHRTQRFRENYALQGSRSEEAVSGGAEFGHGIEEGSAQEAHRYRWREHVGRRHDHAFTEEQEEIEAPEVRMPRPIGAVRRAMSINAPSALSPWHGYDADCPERRRN